MAVFRTKIRITFEEEYLIEAPSIAEAHFAAGNEFWETHAYKLVNKSQPVRRVIETLEYPGLTSLQEARGQNPQQLTLFTADELSSSS